MGAKNSNSIMNMAEKLWQVYRMPFCATQYTTLFIYINTFTIKNNSELEAIVSVHIIINVS